MRARLRPTRLVPAALVLGLIAPAMARAQAWLPPKGEAYYTFAYQYISAADHLTYTGDTLDRGYMRWNYLISDLNYGVTDRLTFRVGIPYVISKYTGDYPHKGQQLIDDGTWNGTFADFRLEALFMAKTKGLVVTPFASLGLPSHQYETHAHVAAGKALTSVTLGVGAGRLLDPILSDGYAQTRMAYTFQEKVLGISHDRTNLDVEVGYFVTAALTVSAVTSWQWTHGGWTTADYPPPTSPNFQYHDQLTQENFFNLGLSASYTVLPAVDVFVTGFSTIWGENTVKASGVAVGIKIGFSPARILRKAKESEREEAAAAAARGTQ